MFRARFLGGALACTGSKGLVGPHAMLPLLRVPRSMFRARLLGGCHRKWHAPRSAPPDTAKIPRLERKITGAHRETAKAGVGRNGTGLPVMLLPTGPASIAFVRLCGPLAFTGYSDYCGAYAMPPLPGCRAQCFAHGYRAGHGRGSFVSVERKSNGSGGCFYSTVINHE
jgi:hypothetical protein